MYINLNEREVKNLDMGSSTSIVCDVELLNGHEELKKVVTKGANAYFQVENTNSCIMYVEENICILTDYLTDTYDNPGVMCSLPMMLSVGEYVVYQVNGRDWIRKRGALENGYHYIGYDIKRLIHGDNAVSQMRSYGFTLDHLAQTFDEREKNKDFNSNKNNGSHRERIMINNKKDLDDLIQRIKNNDGKNGGI